MSDALDKVVTSKWLRNKIAMWNLEFRVMFNCADCMYVALFWTGTSTVNCTVCVEVFPRSIGVGNSGL